jgi:2-polyprenyl-6-methoxyphenol hydroxylase-like FAD-dependent oxidoreductase
VLSEFGLLDQVLAAGSTLESFENRTSQGRAIARWPIGDMGRRIGFPSISISRSALHRVLWDAAPDRVTFGADYQRVEADSSGVTAHFGDAEWASADILIGADGLRSKVRETVLPGTDPRYAGYLVFRGLVDSRVPVPAGLFVQMWGRGARFGYYRITPEQTYWFAVLNAAPDEHTEPQSWQPMLAEAFGRWAGPVPELIRAAAPGSILRSRIYDRDPELPWCKGRVTLLGDAIHPMTFNVGQGACQAIEDAATLGRTLRTVDDPVAALREYESARHSRTSGLTMRARRIGNLGRLDAAAACAIRDVILRPLLSGPAKRQQELVLASGATLLDG